MNESKRLGLEEFGQLFSSFNQSAFRLESRESYYEQDELKIWLQKGPSGLPDNMWQEWYDLMSEHRRAGRSVRRVRVVSEPHSDYTRFGLWISNRNARAGEDIRYLERSKAEELEIPAIDYWLFDSNRLDIVLFDDENEGELLGAEETVDPERVKQAKMWLDTAWDAAVPRDVYAAAWRHEIPEDS
jgi:hypothetical protein